jgi:hypothetical protein
MTASNGGVIVPVSDLKRAAYGGEQPIDVARDFLIEQGIIDPEE